MMLKQLFIVLSALFSGYLLTTALHLPIPANVVGFALLFTSLCLGIVKLHHVDRLCDFIIKYLAVFFVVPSVGIMRYFNLIGEQLFHILFPLFLSIIVGFFTAAKVTEIFIKFAERKQTKMERKLGGNNVE